MDAEKVTAWMNEMVNATSNLNSNTVPFYSHWPSPVSPAMVLISWPLSPFQSGPSKSNPDDRFPNMG